MSRRFELAPVGDLEPDSSRRVDVDGHRIALIRIGDDYYAIGDECSHADVSLAEGELDVDERAIECWKHGSLFCVESGQPLSLPATRPVPTYRVEIDGEHLVAVIDEDGD